MKNAAKNCIHQLISKPVYDTISGFPKPFHNGTSGLQEYQQELVSSFIEAVSKPVSK
jgi:hypothetical protein